MRHIPSDLDGKLERPVLKMDNFLSHAYARNISEGPAVDNLDLSADLKSIGWQITLLDLTKEQAARKYSISVKAINQKKRKLK
jgi:hypothetical protein